ncbi:hypothetical protein [Thermofilum pendens]|uniref:DUF3194 domain-containing protein n=1 Tax=Thermofilum pendens (strain DSM 2475 / Hrk 5) TaxID=368408 RepID=A1RXX7_THEPD|nr:hypothetical protein [Thermofilum pendens]ABL78057.1 hypothetical protein Tpen_0655 [Thermofilum pendens Hrk 5]
MRGRSKREDLEELERVSMLVLEEMYRELQEALSEDPELQLTIKVEVDEDWPYDFRLDVEVSSKLYDKKTLEDTLNRVVSKYLKKAEEELRKAGLQGL